MNMREWRCFVGAEEKVIMLLGLPIYRMNHLPPAFFCFSTQYILRPCHCHQSPCFVVKKTCPHFGWLCCPSQSLLCSCSANLIDIIWQCLLPVQCSGGSDGALLKDHTKVVNSVSYRGRGMETKFSVIRKCLYAKTPFALTIWSKKKKVSVSCAVTFAISVAKFSH